MATLPMYREGITPLPMEYKKIFYAGGSTLADVFDDFQLTVQIQNPIQANSAGMYPPHFVRDGVAYDIKYYAPDGSAGEPGTPRDTYEGITASGDAEPYDGLYLPLAGEKRVSGWVAFDATVYGTVIDMSVFNLTQSGLELKTGTRIYGGGTLEIVSGVYMDDPRALTLSIDSMGSGPGGVTPVNSTHLVGRNPVTGLLVPVELDLSGSYIPIPQKAAANGVATLGVDGKVPVGQVNRLSSALDAYDYLIQARISGDANYRFAINSRGDLCWANGSGYAGPYIEQSASSELHVGNAYVRAYGFRANGGLVSEILLADGTKAVLPYVASTATESDPYVRIIGFLGTTTNDSAPAGCVGELLSSIVPIGSRVSLTTATPKDVTSITLGPGEWDVWGISVVDPTSTGTISFPSPNGSISLTANTDDLVFAGQANYTNSAWPKNMVSPHRPVKVASGATTTVHLVANVTFSSGNCYVYGNLYARRVR